MSIERRFFISAVTPELKTVRELVATTLKILGHDSDSQEDFAMEEGELRAVLREKIDQCDGLIQLVGSRFGSHPIDDETESYTQYEYRYARQSRKKAWRILLDDTFPPDRPSDEPPSLRERQERYRRQVARDTHIYHPVANRIELEITILKLQDEFKRLRTFFRRWMAGVSAGLVLLVGLVLWVKYDQGKAATKLQDILHAVEEKNQRDNADLAAGERLDDPARNRAFLNELEKNYRLPANFLVEQLPGMARKLANDPTVAPLDRAQFAYALQDYPQAEQHALQAADRAEKAVPPDLVSLTKSLGLAGWTALRRGDLSLAKTRFERAAPRIDRDLHPLEWADLHFGLAYVLDEEQKHGEAERLLREVVRLRTWKLGANHRDTLDARNNLAIALSSQGGLPAAIALHRQNLRWREEALGHDYRRLLQSWNNLGVAINKLGSVSNILEFHKEAETNLQALLLVRQRLLGATNLDTLNTYNNLGEAVRYQKRNEEAEAIHRDVLRLREQVLGPDAPLTASSRFNLALCLYQQSNYANAETELRKSLDIRQRKLGPDHDDVLQCCYLMGRCLKRLDRLAEALDFARRAMEGVRPRLPSGQSTFERYKASYEEIKALQ